MAKIAAVRKTEQTALNPVSDGAREQIKFEEPYSATFTLEGVMPLLLHGWNVEAVGEKAAARKGSKQKKEDNVESYVFRDADGDICLPGVYVHAAIRDTGKFRQDPRSPRKSMYDLLKAAVFPAEELFKINGGVKTWDYLDQRRVVVQRNGITRMRPAFLKGWRCTCKFNVTLPEYLPPDLLLEILNLCGRVNGMAEIRPTYGRFAVTEFACAPF